MIDPSIKKTLNESGFIVAEFKGTSMNPLLISGRDKVLISKCNGRLKKGDVALYLRDNGTYILHRVYKVLPFSYVFCGDNHYTLEYGVKDENIIGVCDGYFKGEKYIDFKKSFKYKCYKFFWCKSLKVRKFLNKFRRCKKNK